MTSRFKEKVLEDYYEWFDRNKEDIDKLSINERINKFLKYEKRIRTSDSKVQG